jgi:hypothetical protein
VENKAQKQVYFLKKGTLVTISENPMLQYRSRNKNGDIFPTKTLAGAVKRGQCKYLTYDPLQPGVGNFSQYEFEIYHHKYGKSVFVSENSIGLLLDDIPQQTVDAMLNNEPGIGLRVRVLIKETVTWASPFSLQATETKLKHLTKPFM